MSDAYSYNRSILADIEHLAAHIESGDDFTDHCERVCVADESRGLSGQISHVWDFVLSDADKENVAEYWFCDSDLDFDALSAVERLDAVICREDQNSEIADAIEAVTNIYWDGDVFEREADCSLWREFERDEWALSVETQGEHVEICISCGGPGTYARRDFDGDKLVTFWGSDKAEARNSAISTVLDYFAEMVG